MTVIEAVILGVIQGLTELLPVSSSGHLRLGRELFGLMKNMTGDQKLAFDVLVHAGTLVVIIAAFRKEIFSLLRGRWKLWKALVIGSIPAGIAGVSYELLTPDGFELPLWLVGVSYFACGTFLLLAEKRTRDDFALDELGAKPSLLIGFAQAVAILPGVSRSGTTIITGGLLGLKRLDAMAYSFLLSIVAISGALLLEVPKIMKLGEIDAAPLAAGFVSSVAAGSAAIWTLKYLVRKRKLAWFGPYCLALGVVAFILFFRNG